MDARWVGGDAPCPAGSRRGVTGELLLAAPGKGPCSSSATRTVSESRKPGDLMVLNVPGPGCAVIKCISSIVSCLVACAVKWPRTIRGGRGLAPAQPLWLCSVAFFPLRWDGSTSCKEGACVPFPISFPVLPFIKTQ